MSDDDADGSTIARFKHLPSEHLHCNNSKLSYILNLHITVSIYCSINSCRHVLPYLPLLSLPKLTLKLMM